MPSLVLCIVDVDCIYICSSLWILDSDQLQSSEKGDFFRKLGLKYQQKEGNQEGKEKGGKRARLESEKCKHQRSPQSSWLGCACCVTKQKSCKPTLTTCMNAGPPPFLHLQRCGLKKQTVDTQSSPGNNMTTVRVSM